MASKSEEIKPFDRRCVERNIKLGFIKEDDFQKHLKALPNEDQNFDEVSFEDEEIVLEDPLDEASESVEGQE